MKPASLLTFRHIGAMLGTGVYLGTRRRYRGFGIFPKIWKSDFAKKHSPGKYLGIQRDLGLLEDGKE